MRYEHFVYIHRMKKPFSDQKKNTFGQALQNLLFAPLNFLFNLQPVYLCSSIPGTYTTLPRKKLPFVPRVFGGIAALIALIPFSLLGYCAKLFSLRKKAAKPTFIPTMSLLNDPLLSQEEHLFGMNQMANSIQRKNNTLWGHEQTRLWVRVLRHLYAPPYPAQSPMSGNMRKSFACIASSDIKNTALLGFFLERLQEDDIDGMRTILAHHPEIDCLSPATGKEFGPPWTWNARSPEAQRMIRQQALSTLLSRLSAPSVADSRSLQEGFIEQLSTQEAMALAIDLFKRPIHACQAGSLLAILKRITLQELYQLPSEVMLPFGDALHTLLTLRSTAQPPAILNAVDIFLTNLLKQSYNAAPDQQEIARTLLEELPFIPTLSSHGLKESEFVALIQQLFGGELDPTILLEKRRLDLFKVTLEAIESSALPSKKVMRLSGLVARLRGTNIDFKSLSTDQLHLIAKVLHAPGTQALYKKHDWITEQAMRWSEQLWKTMAEREGTDMRFEPEWRQAIRAHFHASRERFAKLFVLNNPFPLYRDGYDENGTLLFHQLSKAYPEPSPIRLKAPTPPVGSNFPASIKSFAQHIYSAHDEDSPAKVAYELLENIREKMAESSSYYSEALAEIIQKLDKLLLENGPALLDQVGAIGPLDLTPASPFDILLSCVKNSVPGAIDLIDHHRDTFRSMLNHPSQQPPTTILDQMIIQEEIPSSLIYALLRGASEPNLFLDCRHTPDLSGRVSPLDLCMFSRPEMAHFFLSLGAPYNKERLRIAPAHIRRIFFAHAGLRAGKHLLEEAKQFSSGTADIQNCITLVEEGADLSTVDPQTLKSALGQALEADGPDSLAFLRFLADKEVHFKLSRAQSSAVTQLLQLKFSLPPFAGPLRALCKALNTPEVKEKGITVQALRQLPEIQACLENLGDLTPFLNAIRAFSPSPLVLEGLLYELQNFADPRSCLYMNQQRVQQEHIASDLFSGQSHYLSRILSKPSPEHLRLFIELMNKHDIPIFPDFLHTHLCGLIRRPVYSPKIKECIAILLDAGADLCALDPNQLPYAYTLGPTDAQRRANIQKAPISQSIKERALGALDQTALDALAGAQAHTLAYQSQRMNQPPAYTSSDSPLPCSVLTVGQIAPVKG